MDSFNNYTTNQIESLLYTKKWQQTNLKTEIEILEAELARREVKNEIN